MKRILDVVAALIGLLVFSPVMAAIFLIVPLVLREPPIFKQIRIGRDERPFELLKFRTMRTAMDRSGQPLPDAERLSPIGRLLRRSSLDELPQFWNVLRGEMSLVGPRPLLERYLPRYSEHQRRRHEVLPGMTGWSQVNGRNALSWEEKLRLDVWYVEHWTIGLDCRILCLTVLRVLKSDGISQAGHSTMSEFMGSTGTTVDDQ